MNPGPFAHAPRAPDPLNGVRRVVPHLDSGTGDRAAGRLFVTPDAAGWIVAQRNDQATLAIEQLRRAGVGRELVERTAESIGSPDTPQWPRLALIAGDAHGLHVLVHGSVKIRLTGESLALTSMRPDSTEPLIRTCTGLRSVSIGRQPANWLDQMDDVRDGVIRATGVTISWNDGQPQSATKEGLYGVLRFDTGETFKLSSTVTIGRSPADDPVDAGSEARALIPSGDVSGLSRLHASIHLGSAGVVLTDQRSLNGTFVWNGRERTWRRIATGRSVRISDGDMIGFGRRVATLELSITTR